uniref:Uncharacterized protein n=1 Tax=Cacopsylla melanoneura TaxID=428564 RepID=A0A8D8USE9_9HEMI
MLALKSDLSTILSNHFRKVRIKSIPTAVFMNRVVCSPYGTESFTPNSSKIKICISTVYGNNGIRKSQLIQPLIHSLVRPLRWVLKFSVCSSVLFDPPLLSLSLSVGSSHFRS